MNKTQLAIIGYLAFYAEDYYNKIRNMNADTLVLERILKIRKLAKKHHTTMEYQCNGEGFIRGVKTNNMDIINAYGDKIECKISMLLKDTLLKVEYQGDPRGATVKLFVDKRDITDILYI